MGQKKVEDLLTTPGDSSRNVHWFTILASGVAWGILAILLTLIVPRFEAIFQDFGVPLHRSTQAVIRMSHLFRGPVLALPAVAIVMSCLALGRSRRNDGGNRSAWWALPMILLPVALVVLVTAAIGLSLFDLNQKLTG